MLNKPSFEMVFLFYACPLYLVSMWKHLKQKLPGVWKSPVLDREERSAYQIAKRWYESKVAILNNLRDVLLILLGVVSAGFGLKSFLLKNQFIDGGATGIALLIAEKTGLTLSVLLILVNIPFVWIGYRLMGRLFGLKTAFAIIMLAVCTALIPYPVLTHDKVLVAVFGGFFLGAGIGLSVRGGAVMDGTEVMAIYLSKKLGLTMGDIILMFNIVIFGVAAYLLSIETALYSILAYLSASKAVDFLVEGIDEYTGVTIVSVKSDDIREMIIEKLGKGVTTFYGKRGYGKRGVRHQDTDVLYTVITRLEVSRLKTEIEKIDPFAFIVMTSVKDTIGGMVRRKHFKI
jgi:uncharacterized membrane-anchored protein YitT (DUF2179 family)